VISYELADGGMPFTLRLRGPQESGVDEVTQIMDSMPEVAEDTDSEA
jgi:hypothetical protein